MQTNPGWESWAIAFVVALLLLFVLVSPAHGSEPACFATATGAAEQAGVRGVHGYRLASSRRDPLSGVVWATVASCEHPEWPHTVLLASATDEDLLLSPRPRQRPASLAGAASLAEDHRALVMQAGSHVLLVRASPTERLEVSGIVQTSAALGDTVKVRLRAVSASSGQDDPGSWSEQRFAIGIVRSATVVEMVAP